MKKLLMYNWEFKLIAVLLAMALYFYTSDLITIGKTITITNLTQEDEVINYVPEGYVVTDIVPRSEVEVSITGPRKLVDNLSNELSLELELDRESIKEGEQIFVINNRLMGLNPNIKIIDSRPVREIRIKVSRQMYRTVPIDSNLEYIGLPESLLVSEVELGKTDVEVNGPEDAVKDLEVLEVEPIELSSLRDQRIIGRREKNVQIKLALPEGVRTTDNTAVYAKLIIRPREARREMNLPLSVLGEPDVLRDYQVQFAQPVVAVTVNGPEEYLPELREDQLRAYVIINIEDFAEDSTSNLPVYVQSPSWTQVKGGRIRVTVKRRDLEAAVPVEDMPETPILDESGDNSSILPEEEKEDPILPDKKGDGILPGE